MSKSLQLINEATGQVVGERVRLADSFWSRLRGLLGRPPLTEGEGLWLRPCRQVHMFGMSFPLSVWFLDANRRVVAIQDNLRPGERSLYVREAQSVIEFPAYWAERNKIALGDRLDIGDTDTTGNDCDY